MSGTRIVIHLVRCTQSLLICDDIETDHLRFKSMAECEAARSAYIDAAKRQGPQYYEIMGRCRFVLDRNGPVSREMEPSSQMLSRKHRGSPQ